MTNAELKEKRKRQLYVIAVVAVVAVIIVVFLMPVLKIYGSSMIPTLREGDIVLSVKESNPEAGDLTAFYLGNKILVKRCIAGPGQWVDIDQNGNVYVDGKLLDEPYLEEKDFGECNIELPYQVPENRYFCMGDQRSVSMDSRHTNVGCISGEQIIGKIVFRIWPLSRIGSIGGRS